jgi:predicted SAM-dependent methyltransferase
MKKETDSQNFDFDTYQYLNIGGRNFQQRADGWLNLDYPFEATHRKQRIENIDIQHNLMSDDPIPLPDECLKGIYTSHTFEHLTFEAVKKTMSEAYRILKPRGFMRISVPDANIFWDILTGAKTDTSEFPKQWDLEANCKEDIFLNALCTPFLGLSGYKDVLQYASINGMERTLQNLYHIINSVMSMDSTKQAHQPGNHISWWSYSRIVLLFANAGFIEISLPLESRKSSCKAFRAEYIDTTAPACSTQVEARKP